MTTSKLDPAEKQRRVQNRVTEDLALMKERVQTLMMSTADTEGNLNISYTPFAQNSRGFWIYISDRATHTQNLLTTKKAAIMLIDDECKTKVIYARRRLSFNAHAELVEYKSAEWLEAMKALKERHGEIVEQLATMSDFYLFNLIPEKGLFVKGFGKAFRLDTAEVVAPVHLRKGHGFKERSSIKEVEEELSTK